MPGPSLDHPISKMCVYKGKLYVSYFGDSIVGMRSRFMASWDGTKWDTLGGINKELGSEPACFTLHNNELFVGGSYVWNDLSERVFSWDGTKWNQTGGFAAGDDILDRIYAMQSYNGELYVGGQFTKVGGQNCFNITKWNGSSWKSVSGGLTLNLPTVYSMAVYKGELYVAGVFSKAGTLPVNNIARWNGTQWDSLGSGVTGGAVGTLIVDTITNLLYVGGGFDNAGGQQAYGMAKWDGNTWSVPGYSTVLAGKALCMYHGQVYSGTGVVSYGSKTLRNICNWDGNTWDDAGGGTDASVSDLAVYNDDLYVAGNFSEAGGVSGMNGLARYHTPLIVKESKEERSFLKVYPNPAKGILNIEFETGMKNSAKLKLYLFDHTGKEVLCQNLTIAKTQTINTAQLSKGVYIMKLLDENVVPIESKKIVIE